MHYVRFRTDPCSVGDYNGCSVAGALSVKGGCGGAISRRWSTATEFPFLPCCKGVSLVDGKEPAMTPDAPVWMKERRNGLRVRRQTAPRLLSNYRHRFAALRHGEREFRRDRGGGQRRHRRYCPVH